MNFYKRTPFIVFVLLYLACLLSQIKDLNMDEPKGEVERSARVLEESDDNFQMINLARESNQIKNKVVFLQTQSQNDEPTSSTLKKNPQSSISTKRLLQAQVNTNNLFLYISRIIFVPLLSISRNLIIIGIVTNSIELFLPYIILCQSFLMIAFWNCQKHYLATLYTRVFSSYWDLFNAIRLISQPSISTNAMLGQYEFSSILIFNLSGQTMFALLLLTFTVISKFFSVCLKYERLRMIAANLRPIWNGYFFSILPRVATFVGLHWKLGDLQGFDAVDTTVCTLLSALIIFYFIFLLVQIRRIRQKKQLIQQRVKQLGLVKRLNYKKQFRFDCLRYSSMYYPAMRYLILVFYFISIGLSWDFYYVSFGGPIIAQLTSLMFEVSSTPYILLRDKIISPLNNFLFVIVHLCIITVGLAQSVSHSEVSQIAETILFSILIFVLGSSLVGTIIDTWAEIKKRCQQPKQQEKKDASSVHNFTRQLTKNKTIQNSVKKSNQSEEQSEQNGQDNHQTSAPLKKDTQKFSTKLKIYKVKKGKVI